MGVTNLVLEVTNRKKSRGSAFASPPLHSGGARRASRRSCRSERSEHCVVLLTCALLVRGLGASAGVSGPGEIGGNEDHLTGQGGRCWQGDALEAR